MKSKCSFDCRELPPCDKCKMVGCVHAPEKSPQEKLIDSRMNDILENAKHVNEWLSSQFLAIDAAAEKRGEEYVEKKMNGKIGEAYFDGAESFKKRAIEAIGKNEPFYTVISSLPLSDKNNEK